MIGAPSRRTTKSMPLAMATGRVTSSSMPAALHRPTVTACGRTSQSPTGSRPCQASASTRPSSMPAVIGSTLTRQWPMSDSMVATAASRRGSGSRRWLARIPRIRPRTRPLACCSSALPAVSQPGATTQAIRVVMQSTTGRPRPESPTRRAVSRVGRRPLATPGETCGIIKASKRAESRSRHHQRQADGGRTVRAEALDQTAGCDGHHGVSLGRRPSRVSSTVRRGTAS